MARNSKSNIELEMNELKKQAKHIYKDEKGKTVIVLKPGVSVQTKSFSASSGNSSNVCNAKNRTQFI